MKIAEIPSCRPRRVVNVADPFLVQTPLVPLTVATAQDAVTAIRLWEDTKRPPATPFEHRVADELAAYFAGTQTAFTLDVAPAGTPFQQAVWQQLSAIPYGETRTYGQIAHALGNPGAARAVGMANHHNPVPIIIPCHRVVETGGRLGGFAGGTQLKRKLLQLESSQSSLF